MSQMVHAPPVLGLTTQLKKKNQTINAKLYKPNYIFTGKCWQCCHVHLASQWVVGDNTIGNPRMSRQAQQHNYRSSIFNISTSSPFPPTETNSPCNYYHSWHPNWMNHIFALSKRKDRCGQKKKKTRTETAEAFAGVKINTFCEVVTI